MPILLSTNSPTPIQVLEPMTTFKKATARATLPATAALAAILSTLACNPSASDDSDAGATADAAPSNADASPSSADGAPMSDAGSEASCASDATGLSCVFALYDQVVAECDPDQLAELTANLDARHGHLPLWHQGRALFVSYAGSAAVAGDFNDWDAAALATSALCSGELFVATAAITSGYYRYKLVRGDSWSLDSSNWAFAFDDYVGNDDGRNSVLNTYDSGRGHLVQPEQQLCSTELGNCRWFTTYLPAAYQAPANAARSYPVVFMHDGQNIYDDHDCCFGHTGWEVNVQADADIASAAIDAVIIVGFDHAGDQRGDEYAYPAAIGGAQEQFMDFQVTRVQPTAASYWRLDSTRYYTAGSSFGGLIALSLALTYPDVYAGAASLSGAFWPGQEDDVAMRDLVAATGHVGVALYLDHGGSASSGGDGYADNLEVRDLMVGEGWQRQDAPSCTATATSLCYFHDVDATHDELAWRDRSFLFLRYFFAP